MDSSAEEKMQLGGDSMDVGAVGGWSLHDDAVGGYDYYDGVFAIGVKGKSKSKGRGR